MVTRRNLNAVKTDDMASDGNNLREEEDICTQRVNISGDHSYNSKGPRTRAESDAFPRAFFPSPGALPSPHPCSPRACSLLTAAGPVSGEGKRERKRAALRTCARPFRSEPQPHDPLTVDAVPCQILPAPILKKKTIFQQTLLQCLLTGQELKALSAWRGLLIHCSSQQRTGFIQICMLSTNIYQYRQKQ